MCMLSIKLDYDALVSLLKPVPSWFHLLASAFDPLTTFFFWCFFVHFLHLLARSFLSCGMYKPQSLFCYCFSLLFIDTSLSNKQSLFKRCPTQMIKFLKNPFFTYFPTFRVLLHSLSRNGLTLIK